MHPVCSPNPCIHGTCIAETLDNGTIVPDCSPCEPGWQGEWCNEVCVLGDEKVDISLVMDVSGSLQEAPDKQLAVYEFLHNFVRLFDTLASVRVSLVTFSHYHQVDISPVQHMTTAGFTSVVFNINWIGETTAAGSAIAAAHDTMNVNDNINDVMVIMTDGWDSDILTVNDNIAAAGADGITTLAVGFGAGGFYNEWSLLDMAQGIQNNVFIAATPQALETIVMDVFAGVCTANAAKAKQIHKLQPPVSLPSNVFLMQAAGQYLDIFGFLPSWTPGYSEWQRSQG